MQENTHSTTANIESIIAESREAMKRNIAKLKKEYENA